MQRIPLGRSELRVTDICLGTMTFGTQTNEADAHRQLSVAAEAGVNFLDTAEMYPTSPVSPETVGGTEEIIGRWIAQSPSNRDAYRIATKVSGKNESFVRVGQDITPETFREAFEGSLRRLQVDHIDLYQLHWPNRGSYHFRQNWTYDPSGQDRAATLAHMEAILETAADLIAQGKLGALGLSNESAWGTAQWLRLSEDRGLPRIASIQNEYSLLCRLYDTDLAELAMNEDVTLLAFSPLAAGLLTGKYQGGAVPDRSRMSAVPNLGGRVTGRVFDAVAAYLEIAERHGLDPVQMAIAFTLSRPFPVSSIIGASSTEQLARILDGRDLALSDEVLAEIDTAHRAHPMPY
ncbi:aldo/keto reductase [Rhodobacterales bacterium HKCCE2091]|nr:aldo/keto reductase [Rhodobacterales bacterium HKCCE2091]